MIPDIPSFPAEAHLVYCYYPNSLGALTPPMQRADYLCSYFCSASLLSDFVVGTGSGCITADSGVFAFSYPSPLLARFEVLAGTTDSDESIRYKFTGGGHIFVAKCLTSPCADPSNLVAMGEVFMSSSLSLASGSHFCTTCTIKKPIPAISTVAQSGAFTLFYGSSYRDASVSVPGSLAFTRQAGAVMTLVSFDRALVSLSAFPGASNTVERLYNFHLVRPQSVLHAALDEVCQELPSFTSSLTTVDFVQAQFLAKPQCVDATTGASPVGAAAAACVKDKYLPFTGVSNNQALTLAQAGTVALCTCSVLGGSNTCSNPLYYVYSSLLVVAGPVGGQSWSVPVGQRFGLTIRGYGLGLKSSGRDFIRIVSSSSKCTDSSGKPNSITSLKIGCPDCQSMAVAGTSLAATSVRSVDDVTVPKMKKITVYEGSTLVEFSASIADLLESGDMIVLALDSLRVDGKVRANWGTSDTVRALKIAGRSRYADTWTTCAAGDCDDMLTGHRVEVVSETLVSLPVGLDEFESVSITVTNGEWERHSRLTVAESIVATAPLVNAVVCWGRLQADNSVQYFAEAGKITFYTPPSVPRISLAASTSMAGIRTPVVLSFVPDFRKEITYGSLAAAHAMEIRLTFLNLAKLALLPVSDLDPLAPLVTSALDSLSLSNIKSKSICGIVFSEFWFNDDSGFPQPESCSFSPVRSDLTVSVRQVSLFFAPSSWNRIKALCQVAGQRSICTYQLAFHGSFAAGVPANDPLVKLDIICSNCNGDGDPFYTIETGTALAPFASVSVAGGRDTVFLPTADSSAFTYVASSGKDAIVPLTTELHFGIAQNGGTSIGTGNVIRVSLMPVLQWNVTSCSAVYGAVSVPCVPETVTALPIRNAVVKLTLPAGFASITSSHTAGGDVAFTQIFTITLQAGQVPGMFSQRFMAQISSSDNAATVVGFAASSTLLTSASGSLAGRMRRTGLTGDGPLPFTGQAGDFVEIQVRASQTVMGPGSVATLTLPHGYWCVPLPGWALASANVCRYSLASGEIWNANSWQFFTVTVVNPTNALPRSAAQNEWSLTLASAGPGRVSPSTSLTDTLDDASDAEYAKNRAVILPLEYVDIQPDSLSAPTKVTVFVKTALGMAAGSGIVIIAPPTVTLSGCAFFEPQPAYVEIGEWRSMPLLPGDLTCDSAPYVAGQNSKVVRTSTIFDPSALIKFNLAIGGGGGAWFVFLIDSVGAPLEGSMFPVEYDGLVDAIPLLGSWPLAPADAHAAIVLTRLVPLESRTVTITGLRLAVSVGAATVTVRFPPGFSVVSPEIENVEFVANEARSLDFQVTVSASEALWAEYVVFVEIRSDGNLIAASVVPLPPIAVIKNAAVSYSVTTIAASNQLSFRFFLTSALVVGDRVTVAGDFSGFQYVEGSVMTDIPGARMMVDASGFTIDIFVRQPVASGNYFVSLGVTNPAVATLSGAVWTISSTKDADVSVTGPKIHSLLAAAAMATPGQDNRLGRMNVISFSFQLDASVNLATAGTVVLRGPPGFVFADDCSAAVTGLSVTSCRGSMFDDGLTRSIVTIAVSGWASRAVVFSIPVRNPMSRSDDNFWTIAVNNQYASNEIESFDLRNLQRFEVLFASTAVSASVRPVEFIFTPRRSLTTASSGFRVVSPAGYALSFGANFELRDLTTGIKFSESDFTKSVTTNELVVTFVAPNSIVALHDYALTIGVVNGVASSVSTKFVLTTFTAPNQTPVEESTCSPTVPVGPIVAAFTVTNPTAKYSPNTVVSASTTLRATNYPSSDIFELAAPFGFSFWRNGACLVNAVGVTCDADHSKLRIAITTSADIHVDLPVLTPAALSTRVVLNYWRVEELRSSTSQVVASGAAVSWPIIRPLSSVSVPVSTGFPSALSAVTRIEVSFVASSEANFVFLQATAPAGISFADASSVSTIVHSVTTACIACIGVSGVDIQPGELTTVVIDGVKLSSTGGLTQWTVATFLAPEGVMDPRSDLTTSRDQSTGVVGFSLAGHLTVASSTVRGPLVPPAYVTQALNPQLNVATIATVSFSIQSSPVVLPTATQRLDQPVMLRWLLAVPSADYSIDPSLEHFAVSPQIGKAVGPPTLTSQGPMSVVTAEFRAFMSEFRGAAIFDLTLPVVPLRRGGNSVWRIDMYANDTLLNTNDGASVVPSVDSSRPVLALASGIAVHTAATVAYAAPNTDVELEIVVTGSQLPTGTDRILLLAPTGFSFVRGAAVVGATVTGDASKITIAGATQPLTAITTLRLNVTVHTPTTIGGSTGGWVGIAYDNAEMLAWGTFDQIRVSPIPALALVYGGTSGVAQSLAIVDFTVRQASTFASIEILPPVGVTLGCYEAELSALQCTHESTLATGLILSAKAAYLRVGTYSVPLRISLPLADPATNTFDVIVRNADGDTADGSYAIPGREIADSMRLSVINPVVTMTSRARGSRVTVHLSFELKRDTTAVDAISIKFPPSYSHEITSPSEVGCLNRGFPRASPTDWLYLNTTNAVTFLVDDTQSSLLDRTTGRSIQFNKIPGSETYGFTFPVMLPQSTPDSGNYWTLSFCESRYNLDQCTSVSSTVAIAQFPILGDTLLTP